jgi:hypothetical protein
MSVRLYDVHDTSFWARVMSILLFPGWCSSLRSVFMYYCLPSVIEAIFGVFWLFVWLLSFGMVLTVAVSCFRNALWVCM